MKLYYSSGACSLAPHIVLQELGLAHELIEVDFSTPPANFEALNPMGAVPVLLLDDGKPLTEGAVIMQYLADLKPEAGLAPKAGTLERYHLQEKLNFISSEVHKGFGILFGLNYISKNPAALEDIRTYGLADLDKKFQVVSDMIGKKDFLLATGYSIADSYLFTVLNWTGFLKIDLSKFPTLVAYMERVKARPAVQRALKIEELI